MTTKVRPERIDYTTTAKRIYADPSDDDIEVDEGADISQNDEGGCWVQAWVYVRDTDVPGFEEV